MQKYAGLGAVLLAVAACQDATSPRPVAVPVSGPNAAQSAVANDYIVTFRSDESDPDGQARGLVTAHGGRLKYVYRIALKGFAVADLPDAAVEALQRNPRIAAIERDGIVTADETQIGATWGIDRIDERDLPLDGNYAYDADGSGVTVYIIDTGIRAAHAEFGGRASGGTSVINDGNGTNDCHGHGTHVAGTVGGTTYGVAKNVTLVPVRVLNCSGSGTDAGVIAGIDWVTAHHTTGKAVANMSLGGSASTALDNAVANSIADGITYAVAAGNSNANACNYSPARAPNALTVASTTISDARSSFSNYGMCVDIHAPGSSITSAWNTSNTATNTISGTSMASPHVAGAAAVYLSANPPITPAEVATALKNSATTGHVTGLTGLAAGTPNLLLYTGPGETPPPPPPPTGDAGFTFSCAGGYTCTFNATTSGQTPYAWNFGDGVTGSGIQSTHTYQPGNATYTVTLTVAGGASSSKAVTCHQRKGCK